MQAENILQPTVETVWIGIDVSKKTVDAAIHSSGKEGTAASFPRTREGMAELIAWAREGAGGEVRLRACLEATGRYSAEVAAWLVENDPLVAPAIVNPLHAKRFAQSLGLRNKTDRVDARMLARLGAERSPVPYEPPTKVIAELRELVRERRTLVEEQTRIKNRISEGTGSRFVARERERQLKNVGAAIARLDKEIDRVVEEDASLKADIALLLTIPGVGKITAATVLAELGDLRRFASGRQLAAFAGLSPRRVESGSSVRGKTRLCKQGNPSVRAALYMSGLSTSRLEKGMKAIYDRMIANKKQPMTAIGALMRRQLVLMRAILVSRKPYAPPVEKSASKGEKWVA